MHRSGFRRTVTTLVAVAGLAAAFLTPVSATASSWPAAPAGLHVASVSHSAFTITLQRSANAHSYRLFVSTLKSDVYYANLEAGKASAARRTFSSTTPRLTASGLAYRTVPYYYRLAAVNGSLRSYSGIRSIGLRPDAPTSLTAASSSTQGTYLTWRSSAATGFTIKQATDPAMTVGVQTRPIRGTTSQYTPYGLAAGRTYYFRVRAVNNGTPSSYTPLASVTVRSKSQSVRVMSYNLLQLESDGTRESGGVISPWSQRRVSAAALIKSVNPDVLAAQEGRDWVGSQPGVRQVDSLASQLHSIGEDYTVANTEGTFGQTGFVRTGDYVLYKPSVYRPVGIGGHWSLGDGRWAAYQELQNVNSGAKFLFVSVHLLVGKGSTFDSRRENETKLLLQQAGAASNTRGVPVIYGGDFNSNDRKVTYTFNGPGIVMRPARIQDARLVGQSHHYERYDSVNEYRRTPYAYFIYIDYIWAPAGIAVTSWGTALRLSSGSFVGTIPSDHNPVYAQMTYPY